MNQLAQSSGTPTLPKRLRWCVGKFVYTRGSSRPMHFMELKRFIIDDAVDFSHLFYLRALRAQMSVDQQLDEALKKWMESTAVKLLAEVVVAMMNAAAGVTRLREIFPGVGLTGEYVQLLLERRARLDPTGSDVRLCEYLGYGPASERNKLLVLHAGQPFRVTFHEEAEVGEGLRADPTAVTVLNHNQSVRYNHDSIVQIERFLDGHVGQLVIAVRCTTSEQDEPHMSVKGRLIQLPSTQRIFDLCRESGGHWYFRFLKGFDAGFFLPDEAGPTGLLVAYRGPGALPLKGFEPVLVNGRAHS